MRVLSIDTSTMMSSISIMEDDKIIGDCSINQEQTHSEKLMVLVDRLLNDLKLNLKDIDLFAVAKGPGSFTGLRIGMTSIKAIAQALDKKIIGVSTLEAMAFSILNAKNILAIIDARGKRYFAGLFKMIDGKLELVFEDLINEDNIIEVIDELDDITIVGDAIAKLPQEIKELGKIKLAPASLNNSIARNICCLAKEKFEQGYEDSYFDLNPNYLRKSQAEINLKKNK